MKKPIPYNLFFYSIMKITFIQSLLMALSITLGYAGESRGQDLLDRSISLKVQNVEVKKILATIENIAKVKFVFSSSTIQADRRVTVSVSDKKLSDVLDQILTPLNISYRLMGGQILLNSSQNPVKAAAEKSEAAVTGKVTDESGLGLPGVSVVEKGTQHGTVTDPEGKYSITVKDNSAILIFSFVGYVPAEVTVGTQSVVDLSLKVDSKSLQEVVVVGYGTQKKADLTGAIATISAEKLRGKASVSYGEALVGQMAGVQVQQTNGAPGGEGLSIRIRGTGSISAKSSPLYVIDGYPVDSSAYSLVNSTDIESIQVLKDASSTAIYGSRGANGVVIITTKKGNVGAPVISFNTSYGVQQVAHKIKMMNTAEYLQFFKDGHNQSWLDRAPLPGDAPHTINDGNDIRSKYTNSSFYIIPESFNDPKNFVDINWQDLIFRNASTQKHELGVSGGSEKTRYAISGSYANQQGIQINTDFKRYNLRTNITSNISKKLETGVSVSAYYSEGNEVANGKDSPLSYALYLPPIYPLKNPDGTYGSQVRNPEIWAGDVANPIGIAENVTNFTKKNAIMASAYGQYEIIEGLKYRLSINGSVENKRLKYYQPSFVDTDGSRAPKTAQARNESWMSSNWLIENTLSYNKVLFTKHSFNLLAGYTTQKSYGEYARVNAQNFPNDVVRTISAGQVTAGTSTEFQNSLISYLARLTYSFDDKYLFSASIRKDGSSRFGSNNKWGTFPSVSAGWRISSEEFMRNVTPVSDLKLRASWGLVGNNKIGDYDAIARTSNSYYVLNGALVNAVNPVNYPNPNLGWEKTRQWNLGLDLGLFQERVHLEADFYNSKSVDLLLNVPVPIISGYQTQLQNIGKVQNKGMEYLVRTRNTIGAFKWSTDFNISFNKNTVLALGPDRRPIFAGAPSAGNTFITTIGQPIATFYGY